MYSTIAFKQHYAFLKIAQYFPALTLIGRVDLLFVYMLSIILFFFLCTPLQFSVDLFSRAIKTEKKTPIAAILSIGAFVFVLYSNSAYNTFYKVFCEKLFPIFWVFSLLPLLLFFLPKKEKDNGKNTPVPKHKKEKKAI